MGMRVSYTRRCHVCANYFFFQSCRRVRLCAVLLFWSFPVLSQLLLTIVHISLTLIVHSWLVNLPTMVSLSDWRESFYFISFVSVWLFHFFSGSFQAVYIKSMYSGPTISCVNRVERWSVISVSQTCIHAMLDMHLHYCIVVNCEWKC